MSIYNRDEISPEWEPVPWNTKGKKADAQELGFHNRAQLPIAWHTIPFGAFPDDGICGEQKEWLMSVDARYYANVGDEDFLLIENAWSGWPDPPQWGLASRSHGQTDKKWDHWGHFPELPIVWTVPEN